ncbi:MAG: site-2 protease family protein [Acidobacteria bacterium]|nr:site-2 protease family protein [Acidobacteriota bacterium]
MKWSWKLAHVAGIGVYMHATFLLLIGWVALGHWLAEHSLAAVLTGIAFILGLFACVVLHEFGHALTARRYGIATRDITLLPIGGIARLERMPEQPRQELLVALAGPAVNVVIAAALYGSMEATTGLTPVAELDVMHGPILERLMFVNLWLVGFNLLPAFPMDGGRVLRALLATRMEYTRATQIAATIGQGTALAFGFLGLVGNPFLVFIALFVWIGAAQEASMVQMKAALAGIPVSRAMISEFRTLSPGDVLDRAVDLLITSAQRDFPVVDDGRVIGLLLHRDLPAALTRHGRTARVAEVMRRDFRMVDSHEMLEVAFRRLQACECHAVPVMHGGRLVGLVTMDNIGEFVSLQAAMGERRRPSVPRAA